MEKFKVEHPDLHSDSSLDQETTESFDTQKPKEEAPGKQPVPNIKDDDIEPMGDEKPDEKKPKIEDPGKQPVPDIKDDDIEPMGDEKPVNHSDQQKPLNKIEGGE